jgi:hypothetical protein
VAAKTRFSREMQIRHISMLLQMGEDASVQSDLLPLRKGRSLAIKLSKSISTNFIWRSWALKLAPNCWSEEDCPGKITMRLPYRSPWKNWNR